MFSLKSKLKSNVELNARVFDFKLAFNFQFELIPFCDQVYALTTHTHIDCICTDKVGRTREARAGGWSVSGLSPL